MGLYVGDKSVGKIFEGQDDEVTELSSKTEGIFPEGEWGGADVITFGYTGADQHWTAPSKGELTIECWGAGAIGSKGGYAKGTINVNKGDKFSIVCGSHGNNGGTYGFNGTSNYSAEYNGGGLAGVFTGDAAVGVNDAARALVIGGGAGGDGAYSRRGGVGGGTTGGNGAGGGCGGIGWGGTQTGRGSGAGGSGQFKGGGPSGTYGSGGGAGWRGGGGNTGDGSGWDDCAAGGGSGYVIASATDRVLTAGAGSNTSTHGKVVLTFKGKEIPHPTYVTSAGAYHNPDLGLISISADGENWVTISDKNVGATVADPENTDSYGDIFQYGNIYHFDGEGSGGTVTTEAQIPDLTGYEGGNLYSNDKYRTNIDWNAANKKLWKPVAFANLLSLQKGPCDRGFHVPSAEEWTAVLNAILELEGEESEFSYDLIARYLLMAHPNSRKGDGDFYSSNTSIYFTNSYIANQNKINAFVMIGDEGSESGGLSATDMNCGGYIRGFRDVAMIPTTEWTKIGGKNTARLPHEYQEVEYIESSGTQRIDLLTTPTSNTKVQFKFMPKGWTGWTALGYYNGNDNSDWRFFTAYGSQSAIYTDHPGRPVFDFNGSRLEGADNTFALNTVYELEMGNYYLKYLNGENILTGSQISGFTGTTTIKLDYSYTVSTHASNRRYYVKIWDGDVLVKDFVPCYRVSDGTIGLYDLVEGKFYTNSGTGTFIKGASVNIWEMPEGYAELEYIQTTGPEVIITELDIKDGYRCKFDVAFTQVASSTTDYQHMGLSGGYLGTSGNVYYRLYTLGLMPNQKLNLGCIESFGDVGNALTLNQIYNIEHSWISGNCFVKVDGTTIQSYSTTRSTTLGGKVAVCGLYQQDMSSQYHSTYAKWYSYKIYDSSDNLVMDFVPCVRDSDGVIGLYDLVTKEFFANAGTGNFVAGPVVFRNGFVPSYRTVGYFPLVDNVDDVANGLSLTTSGTKEDLGRTFTATTTFSNRENTKPTKFVSVFLKINSGLNGTGCCTQLFDLGETPCCYVTSHSDSSLRNTVHYSNGSSTWPHAGTGIVQGQWFHLCYGYYGGTIVMRVNGVKTTIGSGCTGTNGGNDFIRINGDGLNITCSDYIMEKEGWTDEQVADYLNAKKALYGIS